MANIPPKKKQQELHIRMQYATKKENNYKTP